MSARLHDCARSFLALPLFAALAYLTTRVIA